MKKLNVFIAQIIFIVALPISGHSVPLFIDNFDGILNQPPWEIQRGNAWTDNGWVYLHRPDFGLESRGSFITTAEGNSSWAQYRLSTRFYAEGGGNNWYGAFIKFGLKEDYGLEQGTFYRVNIHTPLWSGPESNSVHLFKYVDITQPGWTIPPGTLMASAQPSTGVLQDHENDVEILFNGGQILIKINGETVINFMDTNPIPYGGIGLGSIWESTTRYDYALVEPVPEPSAFILLFTGLVGLVSYRRRR